MTCRWPVLLAVAMFSIPEAVEANHTIATSLQGVLGEKRTQTLTPGESGYYGFHFVPHRSYAAFCWSPDLEWGFTAGVCRVDIRTAADTVVGPHADGEKEPMPRAGTVATYTSVSDEVFFVRIFNASGALNRTMQMNLIVIETTVSSPWYFVNAQSEYEAFAEIRNHTAYPVNMTIRAYDAAGEIAGAQTMTIPGNGNAAVAISSLLVPTGSGTLTITHNGMPGALVANVTTLSALTGLSFDAPFTPRMVWSMF